MAEVIPDAAIIIYPTEDELVRFKLRSDPQAVEPLARLELPNLPSEYRTALQAYTDAVMAKVLQGVSIPEGYTAPRLSFDFGPPPPQAVSPVNGSTEPAARDDMADVWRDIIGEELGGES